jgi:hypothetical protein
MVTIPEKIVYFHIGARDVAYDVAGLGARSDFLHQNLLEFVPKFSVVDVRVKRLVA